MKKLRPAPENKQGSNTGLVVGGATFAVLALLGASVFFAAQSPAPRDPSLATPPADAPAPTVSPSKTPSKTPRPDPDPATPSKDPYADLQQELNEPTAPTSTAPTPEAPSTTSEKREPVKVTRVVDGDTVYLADGRKVRLIGINTPERERPLYSEATAALRKLIEEADGLTLEVGKDPKDKFDRTLAYLYSGDTLLNGEIVRQGLAYCYTWKPNVAKEAELRELQREARTAKRGLWGLASPEPADHYVGQRGSHHFHREGCGRLKRLKPAERVQWSSRDEPLDEGYNPCEDCGS